MKSNSISKGIFCVVLMATLIISFSAPLMAGDSYFEKGKTYYLPLNEKILVLSKPDDFGWMKVRFLKGTLAEYMGVGTEGLFNINQQGAAKEIQGDLPSSRTK